MQTVKKKIRKKMRSTAVYMMVYLATLARSSGWAGDPAGRTIGVMHVVDKFLHKRDVKVALDIAHR
jgi:hypothetical protein